ncbi:MAG TPA: amidohydrolase family protein [Terriglobales bacterium]|nr:amidohydrolase family protein [Terriglobales bacterium]
MRWVGLWILLCSSLLWAESVAKPSEVLVITNVNVVDTRYGSVLPKMTVFIHDGVIAAIGKVGIIDPGARTRVVNGNGVYLAPGLWDMNTHLGKTARNSAARKAFFELYIASGITGLRDLDTDGPLTLDETALQPELEPAHPRWGKGTSDGGLGSARSIEDLNQIFLECESRQAAQPKQSAKKPDGEALESAAACPDGETAHKLFVEISDHATWVVPSLVSAELSSDESLRNRQEFLALNSYEQMPPILGLRESSGLVRSMHRAGVQFLAGTNGPSANFLSRNPMQRELELLVESGFSPTEALQSATFNPALYMAKLNKYGVVEAGHIADLVLFDGNPLEDIRNTRKVNAVILRGRYFSRADLDRMAADAESHLHEELAAGHE